MIKTVKGKVVAGTVAVTLFAGAGVAFGASDAGTKLKAWYDGQFNSASSQIEANVASNVNGRINGLVTEYNGLKKGATDSINQTKNSESADKKQKISKEAQDHIDAIKEEQEHIESYLSGQFDQLRGFANGLINQAGTSAINYANNDLTVHTGAKGTEAIGTLTTDLEGAKATAVNDLNDAINAAKTDLQNKLSAETTQTTDEIIALIDAKIIELRGIITAKRDALVVVQQGLITAKAVELEGLAKSELQGIVDTAFNN
ncbi:hypothetical protein [Bacillus sp. Cr_A10]|uniref:hypothetical protein n=1 Tax=Bacillaceae TaxID=186817 RepID=UPI0023DB4027|nr:hypothetical protein [Bacillus sp. Cr_A10]MDF2067309.1 hypothetical protein [Bacillus sp. Cr_A10]